MSDATVLNARKRPEASPTYGEKEDGHVEKRQCMMEVTTTGPLMLFKKNGATKNLTGGIAAADAKLPANFSPVHLRLLKVLYSEQQQQEEDQDDGPVRAEQWKHIEGFLKNRNNIKTMAAKVKVAKRIQEETTAFEKLVDIMPIHSNAFGKRPIWAAQQQLDSSTAPVSNLGFHGSGSSPRFFGGTPKLGSSPFSPGSSSGRKKYSNTKHQQQQGAFDMEEQGNAFGIVSRFLTHKYETTSKQFHHTIWPFQILAQDAEARVQCLTSQLKETSKKQKKAELDSLLMDPAIQRCSSLSFRTLEESRVRMETKLELWSILLHDVANAMK